MFGITTFMFALGIVALVLVITLEFKITQIIFSSTSDIYIDAYYYAWASITCLMVRWLGDSCPLLHSINGCSVYSMRYYLRLAHSGSLEQRQAHHRHSSALHSWDHRYIKGSLENRCPVLIWNH
jgi:hypothetical protein